MKKDNKSFLINFLKLVETLGNKLPHPFILFTIFSIITLFLSFILSKFGVSISYFDIKTQTENVININNLLTYKNLRDLISGIPTIFINFPSLKIVVLMMMAIGVVDNIGFFNVLMRKYLLKTPKNIITAVFIFMAVNANIMSDAGTIFAITMGGILFSALGRNPKIGIMAGFAACSGGFTANFFVAGTDALLAGITEQAAHSVGYNITVNPLCNYYFMAAATLLLTFVITFVTEKVIVKVEEDYEGLSTSQLNEYKLTEDEERGLKYSFYSFIIFVIIMGILTIPQNAFFRNSNGGFLPKSPLLSSIVMIIFFLFLFVGIGYGIGTKKIKSSRDIPKYLQKGLSQAIPLMVTLLPASIFIHLLNKSNSLKILAFACSNVIKELNVSPLILLLIVTLMTSFLNLFLTSGSTKWLVLSQIVVPTFALLNISPAYAQLAFRIGDSATNIVSPVQNLIPVVLGLLADYEAEGKLKLKEGEKLGFGTVFSLTIPYSVAILITLVIAMIIWYLLDLPIGPGVYLRF